MRTSRDKTVSAVTRLAQNRVARRRSMKEFKAKRAADERGFEQKGTPGDVDFQNMIVRWLATQPRQAAPHVAQAVTAMNVYLRLRPVNAKERARRQFEAMVVINPAVYVLECKFKVCGISKYVQAHEFNFDQSFGPDEDSEEVYAYTTQPLVDYVVNDGGLATCFAYGQTGSGKTYTLTATHRLASADIFSMLQASGAMDRGVGVYVSYFEIFGAKVIDLLHGATVCHVRENASGQVKVVGLEESAASSASELFDLIAHGNGNRRTEATSVHNLSSRSHAVCTITLRDTKRKGRPQCGRLLLIDLAGSERASETKDSSKERRMEGAEINKSLLALKECIRKLDMERKKARGRELSAEKIHVPYRQSKLTLVLKDAFSPAARTAMICCISPTQADQNHTLNTLRYADKIKRRLPGGFESDAAEGGGGSSAASKAGRPKTPRGSRSGGDGAAPGSPRGGKATGGGRSTTTTPTRGAAGRARSASAAATDSPSRGGGARGARAKAAKSPGAKARAKAPKVKVRGTRASTERAAAAKAVVKGAAAAAAGSSIRPTAAGGRSGARSGDAAAPLWSSSSAAEAEPSSLEAALSTLAAISAAARDAASAAEGRISVAAPASGGGSPAPRSTARGSGRTPTREPRTTPSRPARPKGKGGRTPTRTTPTRGNGKPMRRTPPGGGGAGVGSPSSSSSSSTENRAAPSSASSSSRDAQRGFLATRRLTPPSMTKKSTPPTPPMSELVSPTSSILREASQLAREGKITVGAEKSRGAQHTLLAQPAVVRWRAAFSRAARRAAAPVCTHPIRVST